VTVEEEGLERRLENALGKEELQTRMTSIRQKTQGLLDDDAIEALIADEMGMTRQRLSGLSELSSDATVSTACSIDEIEPARTFKSDTRSGRYRRLHVSDGRARMALMLWDEEVGLVEQLGLHPGSRIKILSAVLRNTKYGPQIHVGRNGFIILEEPPAVAGPPVLRDIKDLDGGRVIVKGVLLSFLASGRGRNRTAVGRLFDGTGEVEVQFGPILLEKLSNANVGVELEVAGALAVTEGDKRRLICDEHASLRIL